MTGSMLVRVVGKSFAASAAIAAAQIGIGQALGILRWDAATDQTVNGRLLSWLVFVFATAVLGGATVSRRSIRGIRSVITNQRAIAAAIRNAGIGARRRLAESARAKVVDSARGAAVPAARMSATIAAGLGAAAAFPLVWVPIRTAPTGAEGLSVSAAAISAAAGVVIGMVVTLAALASAPITAGALATVIWAWTFALVSVGLVMAAGNSPATPRLGMLDAPGVIASGDWWLGPYLMIGVAAVLGALVAVTARWLGGRRLGMSLAGFAGPALVASAYLVAGQGDAAVGGLSAAYVASILAATVGLLVSAAIAAAHRDARSTAAPARAPLIATLRPAIEPPRPAPLPALPAIAPALAIEAAPARVLEAVPAQAAQAPVAPAPAQRTPATAAAATAAAATAAKQTPGKPAPASSGLAKKSSATPKPSTPAKPAQTRRAQPIPAAEIQAAKAKAAYASPHVERPANLAVVPVFQTPSAEDAQDRPVRVVPPQPKGRAAKRRLAREISRKLHKREKEHIAWVQNLVNIPIDPELNTRKK